MGSEVQGSGFRVLGSEFSAAADRGSGQFNRKINFVKGVKKQIFSSGPTG